MSPFLQQLSDIVHGFASAPGVPTNAIDALLTAFAASQILIDPANAVIPAELTDPRVIVAVRKGADKAAILKAANTKLRLSAEPYPPVIAATNTVEARADVFGPFLQPNGDMVRFFTVEAPALLSVNLRTPVGPIPGDLLLLIPTQSTPVPNTLQWSLPAGTVWIQAKFLVAGAAGLACVRIRSGTLDFNQPVIRHGALLVPVGSVWTLSLDLEQPPPITDGGFDIDSLALTLPSQLKLHSNAPPELLGPASLSGFGSDLHLSSSGAAVVDGASISFPLSAEEQQWTIGGNRSQVAQFNGTATPLSPRWVIPIATTSPEQLGSAPHGGSIVLPLNDGFTSTFAFQKGEASRWFVATLTANANLIEIQSLQPQCAALYDLDLWTTSGTKLRFAGKPVSKLSFRSERGTADTLAVLGGSCTTQWDTPRRADGNPFDFDGDIKLFGLISSPSGLVLSVRATSTLATAPTAGFVLENLYLTVKPPRRLAIAALFEEPTRLPEGAAVLGFDTLAALPMLPDPYAANLFLSDNNAAVPNALRVNLAWADSQTPTLVAQLDAAVPFPNPSVADSQDKDERELYSLFLGHIASSKESLYLLDLSTREHLFGVAIEASFNNKPPIIENQFSVPMSGIRLLMQPQVQWEPVRIVANPDVKVIDGFGHSSQDGGPTLLGAQSVKLVPVLPGRVSDDLIEAIHDNKPAAALFSLPFGLRAMTGLDLIKLGPNAEKLPSFLTTTLNEPAFGDVTSARQVRLVAEPQGVPASDSSRTMPGVMRQLSNFRDLPSGLKCVLPKVLQLRLNSFFNSGVPLHRVDLSGYGLSTFSEWSHDVDGAGFSKIEFRAMNGRTAYEVIQFRSVLYECGARTVRTVVLERHNSGRVFRIDTGWVAVDAGEFKRPDAFQKGSVHSFQNIRRIRITGPVIKLADGFEVEPVIFDADASIEGATQELVPIYDRPGYVQTLPDDAAPGAAPATTVQLQLLTLLYGRVKAIGSSIDCAVRVGATLQAQISSIVSDIALDDNKVVGFAVAIVGAPKLPNAGQWTAVCIDPNTHETAATDARRGVPFVRNGTGPLRLREPSDARLTTAKTDYALLMATETSRVLFQRPFIEDAEQAGKLQFELPPVLADPYSLAQSTGLFPRPNFALNLNRIASFDIDDKNFWRIDSGIFKVAGKPLPEFMSGGGWGLDRDYIPGDVKIAIDSAVASAVDMAIPQSVLKLNLPDPLGEVIHLGGEYQSVAGGLSKLLNPEILFMGALQELKNILDSLAALIGLEFPFDVTVTAGPGPSFVVHMHLLFRIGGGPDGRVECGLGKFYGQFRIDGELQTALKGVERALLFIEFQGDVQQGIFPPLLYAGGLIRFSVELHESGGPVIQLTFGVVISIGGDLIPGLLAVEGTIKYGYSLIPETLQPGILLGIEARANLLAGLIGFSFSVEVMARLKRSDSLAFITVWAQIHIAATVHVAFFFDEDVDFETQFQQDIPVIAFALVPGAGLPVLAAEIPL